MKISITDAAGEAVGARLEGERRVKAEANANKKLEIDQLLKELWSLPRIGRLITDEDMYDKQGLPKTWM